MSRTVTLIKGLQKNVEQDGKNEQEGFDKFACWCEKTMERKAKDINDAKELITEMEVLMKKLNGEIASHGAEIAQLEKDIAQNNEAVQDATELRNKENKEYEAEKTETEQCLGALGAAIEVLKGAGTKKSFLQSIRAAELMSVVAGVKTALKHRVVQSLSEQDVQIINHFVTKPDDFVAKKATSMAQVNGPNPFGDYAPQSDQITGILKSMEDAFNADLAKDKSAEDDAQKSFDELMATKKQERETLEATQQKQETDHAAKTKSLSESTVTRDDTADQLAADEKFFDNTKEACQVKATQWSVRTRLRTEELNGFQVAVKILSSDAAKGTFKDSIETFVQVGAVRKQMERSSDRANAYNQLKALASKFGSRSVAKIAAEVKTGGHFDKVIIMVDEMIELLRKEEQSDIEHRDRCENSQNANKNELADLDASIKKTQKNLDRMGGTKSDLEGEIGGLRMEIEATQGDMAELLKFRNGEEQDFKKALKDDTDALGLLRKAIAALSSFYKRNKMDVPQLIQKGPEYAKDQDKAPDAGFADANYGGRKSESGGIIAILEMLAEDTEKELKEGRSDNGDAQAKYSKQNDALQGTLDAQEESKANAETELADLEEKMGSYKKFKGEKEADQEAENDQKASVATDCDWVKAGHFEDRRTKRKTEIQGLVDAKSFLATGGSGI